MNKIGKKLLSVVLAVLVLAAGFSTMLSAFVLADDVDVFDYSTLTDITKADAQTFDDNVSTKGGSQYIKTKYADLGIHSLNGILIESSHQEVIGLKVADGFFSSRWKGSETFSSQHTVGTYEDRSEIKAYITYVVEPGTSFTVNYLRYTDAKINDKNINAVNKTYGNLELLVSNDGVNWIPVNNVNFTKDDRVISSYNPWTATIADVGANTRYVKIQFPQHTDDLTYAYSKEKGEWVTEYVPQDIFVIQKTAFKKGTGLNDGEVQLITNNADTSWKGNFLGAIKGVSKEILGDGNNDARTTAAGYNIGNYGDYNNKAWGYLSEERRSIMLNVQPGTRFTLRAQTAEQYLNQIRVALASQGYAEEDTLMEFFVYTSSGDDAWVQHRATAQNIASYSGGGDFSNTGFTTYTIDFIVPENHSYAKIVFPLQGSGKLVEYYVDGQPSGTYTGDVGATGNDLCRMQEVIYTPYNAEAIVAPTYNTSLDYTELNVVNYDSNNYISDNTDFKWHATFGAVAGQNPSGIWSTRPCKPTNTFYLDKGITPTGANYSQQVGTATELTDDQLTYLVYEVAEDSYFEADVYMRKHPLNATWNVEGHDYYAKNGKFEFGVYTSDSLDGEWTKQGSLTYNSVITTLDTDNMYTFATYIPKGAKYVKFVFGLRGRTMYEPNGKATYDENGYVNGGTLINTTYGARYDDALGLRAVRYTANSESHVTDWYSDWKVGDKYYAADGTTNIGSKAPNDANFASDPGSIAKYSGVCVDNQNHSRHGMQVTWSSAGPSENRYIVYHVASGTTFNAIASIDVDYHNSWSSQNGGKDYEFEVYTAATLDETDWTLAVKTDTKTKEQYKTRDIHNINFTVQKGHNYVKIVFPNLGTVSGNVGNHNTNIYMVSYVPYTATAQDKVSYDYTNLETYPESKSVASSPATYGIYSVYAASTSIWVTEGKINNNQTGKGINPAYNNLNYKYDATKDNPYIVYNVEPGTLFSADIFADSYTQIPWWSKETFKSETGEDFEMEIYVSDSLDGEWTLISSTLGETVDRVHRTFMVPEDAKFVKFQYPQKGWVKVTINGNLTEVRGNDLVRLEKVSFVPYKGENDYAKEATDFTDANKVGYDLYKLNNVEATANGVVAVQGKTGAFVEYKVSNAKAFEIKTVGNVRMAVAYDGVNFVDAQVQKINDTYTVNLLGGKQYVRVYLGEGDVITAVNAEHLKPTATFINYTGKTENVDVAYGEIPKTTLNTNRAGYTFTQWGTDGLLEGIYTDKIYKAKYAKDETNFFTVGLKEGSVGNITVNNDRTLTTVRFDDRVTVTADAVDNGAKFDKWVAYDLEGNKIGTISNSHRFSFLASSSIILDAEYVNEGNNKTEEGAFIFNGDATVTDNNDGSWNMSVVWRVNAPADTVITETGILFAKTNLGDKAAWEAEIGGNAHKIEHSTTATNKTLMYTVVGIKAGKDARFALPYAKLENGDYIFGYVTDAQ